MLADQYDSLDAEILGLAQSGQRSEACRLLVRAYGSEILGTCIGRMGEEAGGEDAAQDALARALVALPNYRGTGGLRPWLHRVAANRCIDLLRSRKSRQQRVLEAVEVDTVAAPERLMPVEVREHAAARSQQLGLVRDALNSVKEPDRTWVELHYTQGVSYDEIADDVGISRAAVKQRIWRAVKRVRALCSEPGPQERA
mgnify:CR=1 FL=1